MNLRTFAVVKENVFMENMQVMAVLLAIVVLGYVISRLGYMDEAFDRKLSAMVVDITCPLLILSSTMGRDLPDRSLILPLLGVGLLTYMILTAVAFWLPRAITGDADARGIHGFAMMFANVGFIGYPVVASIFGPKAVFYAAILNMPNTLFVFTVGVMLIKGQHRLADFNPRVLYSPSLLAAYLSIAIVALGIDNIPETIAMPVTMVGNITVPASLLVIGSSMARLPMRQMIGSPAIYVTSAVRLAAVPLALYFLFTAIGFDAQAVNINTVVVAMPVASFGTMFCLKHGKDTAVITELTFVTSLPSVISIPLITLLFK